MGCGWISTFLYVLLIACGLGAIYLILRAVREGLDRVKGLEIAIALMGLAVSIVGLLVDVQGLCNRQWFALEINPLRHFPLTSRTRMNELVFTLEA